MYDITKEQFETLKSMVELNTRTLRGSNSSEGLVTKVELIKNDVKWIRDRLENNVINFRWIIEKLLAPAIVGVVVGVLMLVWG